MPKPTRTQLISMALLARGYSRHRVDGGAWSTFTIYHNHPRQVGSGDRWRVIRVSTEGAIRDATGKPMPASTRAALKCEGHELWLSQPKAPKPTLSLDLLLKE